MIRAARLIAAIALAGAAPVLAQHAHHAQDAAPVGSEAAARSTAPPPEALAGPEHAADRVHDPALMAEKRAQALHGEHGGHAAYRVLVERLEYRADENRDGYLWDAEGWYGGDYHKLLIKTKGDGRIDGGLGKAEFQALYSRAISAFFDLQAGARYDLEPEPARAYLVLGFSGVAPHWLELDAAAFVSEQGDLSLRLEGEADLRITQRLILQPHLELELAAQEVPELELGSGLAVVEAGLRLRYEIVPELAPYLGVGYVGKLGATADFARAAGESAGGWAVLVGVRTWF